MKSHRIITVASVLLFAMHDTLNGAIPISYSFKPQSAKIMRTIISAQNQQFSTGLRPFSSVGKPDIYSPIRHNSHGAIKQTSTLPHPYETNRRRLHEIHATLQHINKVLLETLIKIRSAHSSESVENHLSYSDNHKIVDTYNDSLAPISLPSVPIDDDVQKAYRRLQRLYGLLPEYHGKSITGVLSGATMNKQYPIWVDLQAAIQTIQNEISAAGESTQLDIDYFKALFQKLQITYPNFKNEIFAGAFNITSEEVSRLKRFYALLSSYHGKSVTGILSGGTTRKDYPIWKDVHLAIETIRTEIAAKGDSTQIDLRYFQKLYWLAIRCRVKLFG